MKALAKQLYSHLPPGLARRIADRAGEHLRIIDFSVLEIIRQAPLETLKDRAAFESLLPRLGLCGGLMLYPDSLQPFRDTGLEHMQMPNQFAPYAVQLGRLGIRRYCEIGVKYGGTLVITAEYLQRLDLEDELRRQRDLFEQQSRVDGLTGLANRRRFSAALQEWMQHARASGEPLIMLVLDLDHFKAINDGHGHAVGDACLRIFAQTLQNAFPSPDLAARLGGEEFAVLLRSGRLADAVRCADVLRLSLPEIVSREGPGIPLQVSVGVARFDPERHLEPDALYSEADAALYRAKAQGRNRVCVADGTS